MNDRAITKPGFFSDKNPDDKLSIWSPHIVWDATPLQEAVWKQLQADTHIETRLVDLAVKYGLTVEEVREQLEVLAEHCMIVQV